MRFALLTDLHANREAVEAVLEAAARERIDRYALLGDFVGYGADPAWVVDTVRDMVSRGAIAVKGNHDEAVLRGTPASMRADARDAVEWTRSQLDASQHDFLAALPLTAVDADRLFVHANAWSPGRWDYIESRFDAARSLRSTPCRYTFCGHMHVPMLYHASSRTPARAFRPVPAVAIPVPPHRQWLAIPGSVGQPRDAIPAACYAVFDSRDSTLVFHRVPYDLESAAAKVRAAGLPQALSERLHDAD